MEKSEQPGRYLGPSANVSDLLDSILHGYDKRLRPEYKSATDNTAKGPPIEVGISMHVSSISSISEVDMDFTLDFYFRQYWRDIRLQFADMHAETEELTISQEMLDKIWWPDTFFANAKEAKFHVATTKNVFLRIKPSGEMSQSIRLTVTAMCNMDLTYFPMDSQICTLEIESYGYSTADISYKWVEENDVTIEPGVQLPQFQVTDFQTVVKLAETSTGNYSRLAVKFQFERSLGYYIIQIYIPSCLIVTLSWVSFWLNKEAVPARVALGITTVLTMTTFVSSTNAALPKLSYLKSIDIFLIFCFFMVFMSLMEYAAVSYKTTQSKVKEQKKDGEDSTGRGRVDINGEYVSSKQCEKLANHQCHPKQTEVRVTMPLVGGNSTKEHSEVKRLSSGEYVTVTACHPRLSLDDTANNRRRPCRRPFRIFDLCTRCHPDTIDGYARILFPLAFFVFNALYWCIYLQISKTKNLALHGQAGEDL